MNAIALATSAWMRHWFPAIRGSGTAGRWDLPPLRDRPGHDVAGAAVFPAAWGLPVNGATLLVDGGCGPASHSTPSWAAGTSL
jgi:hypothetical protein